MSPPSVALAARSQAAQRRRSSDTAHITTLTREILSKPVELIAAHDPDRLERAMRLTR